MTGTTAKAKEPKVSLLEMIRNLETRRTATELEQTRVQMREAQRRGEVELVRLLTKLAMAQRSGDREQIARLTDEISSKGSPSGEPNRESNRKQVD